MAVEDFTTYTEVDPNSHITLVGTNHIDHDAYRNEDAYVYKDKGSGHFTDFEHLVDVRAITNDDGLPVVWCLSNAVDDAYGLRQASATCLYIIFTSNQIRIYEEHGESTYLDSYGSSFDTWYYLTIEKSGTALTCKIYSDVSRTTLLDTLSLTLQADHSFQYVFGCNTFNTNTAANSESDVENLDLQEAVALKPAPFSIARQMQVLGMI